MPKTRAEFDGASPDDVAARHDPIVTFRVGPRGDGRISTGEHNPRGGDLLYERGDTFEVSQSIAIIHEQLGHGEIVEAPKK